MDVPENDVLLDEDLQLPEQPEKVREAISKYYRSRPDDYIVDDSDSLPEQNGKLFLKEVIRQLAREGEPEPKKAASLLLNSLGIKGITYDGGRDGRCFVVFDDKVISVINRYNQEAAKRSSLVREGLTSGIDVHPTSSQFFPRARGPDAKARQRSGKGGTSEECS